MSRFLLHYAVNALWQVPLLTLTGALIARLLRPGLLARHLLAIATLLLAVVMPITGFTTAAPMITPTNALPSTPAVAFDSTPTLDFTALVLPTPTAQTASPHIARRHLVSLTLPPLSSGSQALLASLYLIAFLVALARLLASAVHARSLHTSSTPAPLSTRQTLLVSQAAAHFSVPPPLVRIPANPQTGPLLTGLAEPAILLPAPLLHAAPAEFAAVIVHELAHLRRRDLAVNLALRIAALPIAFHPATLLLHARIRHTRELLTDRLAATALRSPAAYAQSLLNLSQQLLPAPTPTLAAGLFEQRHPSRQALEERVMKLIAPPAAQPRLIVRAARAAAALTLSTAALAAVSLLHLTPAALAAQQATPPAQPAAAEQTSAPAAPAPLTPAPEALTTTDDGQTFTTTTTDSTPTSTTRQTYTTTDPHAAPPAVPSTEPSAEPVQAEAPAQQPSATPQLTAPVPPPPPTPPAPPAAALTGPSEAQMRDQEQAMAEQERALAKMAVDMQRMQHDLKSQIQTQLDPKMKASLEAMRKQLESPEFRRQIAEVSDAAARIRVDLNDAELERLQQDGQVHIHEHSQASTLTAPQREALRQAFRQRVEDAKRKFREQLHAAAGDSAQISQASNQFSAEIQSATTEYTSALVADTRK